MTDCAIAAKHWILRHYLWISMGLLIIAMVMALMVKPGSWQGWIGILAIPFAFLVTVQKQKTEELLLFKELFTTFNNRFDGMNDELNVILMVTKETPLTQSETNKLFDYFNLCGEEYFFYRQGYIYPEVWNAWHNGMKT